MKENFSQRMPSWYSSRYGEASWFSTCSWLYSTRFLQCQVLASIKNESLSRRARGYIA